MSLSILNNKMLVHSITKINKQYTTNGSSPVLVLASNFVDYVCKYQRNQAANYSGLLVNEFLASSFLKYWNIESPEIAIVKVKQEHVNTVDLPLQEAWFKLPCFGSLHNKYYREVDGFFTESKKSQVKTMHYNHSFLNIALFDIWTCNEDRHQGNYNLMIDTVQNNKLIPIDHANIFNTNAIDYAPFYISYNESLISSPLLPLIYTAKQLANKKMLELIRANYYICVQDCYKNLPTILDNLPTQWYTDKKNLYSKIENKLFQNAWIDGTWQTFLEYLQRSIIK
jgi:hypothetical protein